MRYGTVIDYFPARGFGFIQSDTKGPDIYFHITALGACQQPPKILPGQPVKYELIPGTEPKSRRRIKREEDEGIKPERPLRPQAQIVELIDRIPGATLENAPERRPDRHPRARRKKPTWKP